MLMTSVLFGFKNVDSPEWERCCDGSLSVGLQLEGCDPNIVF